MPYTNTVEAGLKEYRKKFGLCSGHSPKCQCAKEIKFLTTFAQKIRESVMEEVLSEALGCERSEF